MNKENTEHDKFMEDLAQTAISALMDPVSFAHLPAKSKLYHAKRLSKFWREMAKYYQAEVDADERQQAHHE